MYIFNNLQFNKSKSNTIHIDINSCFATIEQQANPLIRNKCVAVAAYNSNKGCILAASVNAKKLGIKTGMRVFEGKKLCKDLIVIEPDTNKYKYVHKKLKELLLTYTPDLIPKSIDEFVLDFSKHRSINLNELSIDIKRKIAKYIGEYITVSIGISTNKCLAKLASNLKKPNGLVEINHLNYENIYTNLELTKLNGINYKLAIRLNNAGIHNVYQLYNSSAEKLKSTFKSKIGYHWYLQIRGFEIDNSIFDQSKQKSFGHSYSLYKPLSKIDELTPILQKLVVKMGIRLRQKHFFSNGVHIAISYKDGYFWHKGKKCKKSLFCSNDLYREIFKLFIMSPYKDNPVRLIAVSCFNLKKKNNIQLEFFDDINQKSKVTNAIDSINKKYGSFTVTPSNMIKAKDIMPDRISFGKVKEIF